MNELISVIIPVYNHAAVLKKSVNSILAQTYRPFEIVIINDGSIDDFVSVSRDILSVVEKNKINIQIITQANAGPAIARNRGFTMSKGSLVIFWDADTIAQPQMLEKMALALQNNPGESYAYCAYKFGWKTIKSRTFNVKALKKINYIDTTSLIRRVDFLGFDQSLKRFQDWDLWLTMLEKNKTGVFVPEVLFKKIVGGRVGISSWLPRIFYKLPWKTKKVFAYDSAKKTVLKKHGLL